jgi:hypothetical protein
VRPLRGTDAGYCRARSKEEMIEWSSKYVKVMKQDEEETIREQFGT